MVTANTKISQLIKYDKRSIKVIASINSNFKKLENPVLRKVLASRLTVAMAAKIGGVATNSFLKVLTDNGFLVENQKEETSAIKANPHENISETMKHENIVELDVRPILAGGVDPFEEINKTLAKMSDEETLLLINSFEPIPLLNILKNKGYAYTVERPAENVVHTYLYKEAENMKDTDSEAKKEFDNSLSFEDVEARFQNRMSDIDVRDLEMPLPMVSILEELEKIGDHALYVHHKKLPQYLLPELENRGYNYVSKEIDEYNLKLIIYK